MGTQGTKPMGGVEEQNVDFGQLTVPAQRLEEMINWHMIHGTPDEGSRYITVDPNRLAEIAGTTARFPLDPTDPAHAIFLEEGMQKYRDSLSEDDVNMESPQHLEKDWRNFWAEHATIPEGMLEIVQKATFGKYLQLEVDYLGDGGKTISFDDMVLAVSTLRNMMRRIKENEFGYNQLNDLKTLAEMVESGTSKARLAWHLIHLLAEGASPVHKLFAFSIMDHADSAAQTRIDLLVALARILERTSHEMVDNTYVKIVGKTLDILRTSQTTNAVEGNLAAVIEKMLDPSTYPPENARLKDEHGNILTKSSNIGDLIVDFVDALSAQTTVAGSLPARLLKLAADPAVKVNGAFIVLASLSLRQSARRGVLASYYGEPLFDPELRAKLADLSFSLKNINAVDHFLEEDVYDSRRGGGSLPPVPGGPMHFQMPAGTWGMSAAGTGAQALTSIGMFTGMPMGTMPLTIGML